MKTAANGHADEVEDQESTSVRQSLTSQDNHAAVNGTVGSEELRAFRGGPEGDGGDEEVVRETREERQLRRRSHIAAYVTMFIMAVGFSIVLTGVWPYLQELDKSVSKEYLGWVVAANPLGQMLASPLFGLWGNKAGSVRVAFICSILFFILGNAMYAILHIFGTTAKYFMVFSRFIVGVSSANVTICRSYIAGSTTVKERTMGMSVIAASQAIGFIVGPAIQTALAVGFMQTVDGPNGTSISVPYDTDLGVWWLRWNMYTAAGWVAAFIGFLNILLFLPCIFQEYNITPQLVHTRSDDNPKKYPKPDYPALIGILFVFFIILFVYVLLETLLVPMCLDLYAWHTEFAVTVVGIGLSAAGVFCLFIFGIIGILAKYIDERKILIGMGLVPITLSMFMHFPMGSTYPKMSNCTSFPDSNNIHNTSFVNTTNGVLEIMSLTGHKVNDEKEDCDLGCPPEQEWCTYTPIIEKGQMLAADIVALIGYPTSITMVQTIYSKMVGPRPQGVLMGVLTSTGSLSRMAGPIFVSYVYTNLGTRWTFGLLFGCLVLTIIESFYFFKRQVPCVTVQSPTTEPLHSSE